MKIYWILLIILSVANSCTDFNLGYTNGGNPPPPIVVRDTIVDTAIVAADSLIVKTSTRYMDTVDLTNFRLRAGNYALCILTPKSQQTMDDLTLTGLIITTHPLMVSMSSNHSAFTVIDSSWLDTAGSFFRFNFQNKLSNDQDYVIRITNQGDTDLDVSTLMVLNYRTEQNPPPIQSQTQWTEYRNISIHPTAYMEGMLSHWVKFAVDSGDQINGNMALEVDISSDILSSAQFLNILNGDPVQTSIWNARIDGATIHYTATDSDTLFYLSKNKSSDSSDYRDSLVLQRHLP